MIDLLVSFVAPVLLVLLVFSFLGGLVAGMH